MDISIIIVSYNTNKLIIDCLDSLQKPSEIKKEIFIIDNASTDETVKTISVRFPAVNLIANNENKGFGAANNQAIPSCRGKYLLFLNPDTTVAEDTLQKSFLYMETNKHVGLAGFNMLNPDGSHQPSVSNRYPGEKYTRAELADLKGPIACVLGAAMIARPHIITQLGGFDEDFFLYGEDQDLCLRIRRLGYQIGYMNDAKVIHLGGQSEIKTLPAALYEKKMKAEYLFYKKHYSAETIHHIKIAQRRKAKYRLITLKLSLPFVSKKAAYYNKIECYEIALKLSQD
jgi:N-acetylglucosaminyl-diphospho-decaprenol L-rhamnosyltransferase